MTREEQEKWLAQWRAAGEALARVRAEELAAMTEEERAAVAVALTSLPRGEGSNRNERADSCGLIEQQRVFAKSFRS
jgi:hypothetical protein